MEMLNQVLVDALIEERRFTIKRDYILARRNHELIMKGWACILERIGALLRPELVEAKERLR